MKKLVALSVLVLALVATSTANAQSLQLPHKPFNTMTRAQKVSYLRRQIRHDRGIIRFYHHHRTLQSAELVHAAQWARISLRIATHNLHKLTVPRYSATGSDMSAWLCIHGYEGAWDAIGYVNGVATYFGGLQEDITFQKEYGPEFYSRWGTANHWPIWAQITAARRARDGFKRWGARGYGPWPRTAALCGLR